MQRIALLALALASSTASAQPSGAQAETLFRSGRELMAAGKIAEACAAFDASQQLDPAVSTLLNLASCRERNGQLATAWGLFLEAQRQTRGAPSESEQTLHRVAGERVAKLAPRLSTLTIAVPEAHRVAELVVLRDGAPVHAGAWGKALPIDRGTYTIAARAPGSTAWSARVEIALERDAKTVAIPKLAAVAQAEPPRSRLPAIVATGLAVAAAGGAFALWRSGESLHDRSKLEPDRERQLSLWRSANTRRHAAQALAGVGVATAAVAVWLFVRRGKPESRVVALPLVGERAGLALEGRW